LLEGRKGRVLEGNKEGGMLYYHGHMEEGKNHVAQDKYEGVRGKNVKGTTQGLLQNKKKPGPVQKRKGNQCLHFTKKKTQWLFGRANLCHKKIGANPPHQKGGRRYRRVRGLL